MAIYTYEIGSSSSTLVNVETLASARFNPPRGDFKPYSVELNRGDGSIAGHGFPYAIWTFDVLTQTMLTALKAYCSGRSATVFIRTRTDSGSFGYYTGVLVWPSLEILANRHFMGRYLGLSFQFRRLETFTPS